MKEILNRLTAHQTLDKAEAKQALMSITKGNYNNSQITAFLMVYMMRSITIEELEGFRDALLELCVRIDLDEFDPIDLCGTGGDGKDTFNISTLASFVCAGAGIKVAKHGNYGVSSGCGSSNVLESLGIKFTNDESFIKKALEEAGICYLHAPLFHPAMKSVAPVRKELGMKTFFNILGPMVNPSHIKKQMVGVYSLELARLYGYLYQKTDKQFVILHALDGYDEISLTGDVKFITHEKEGLYRPKDFGVDLVSANELVGGNTVESSAKIFLDVLNGEGTETQNNVVCANAAMAIHASLPHMEPKDGFALAKESLKSGRALETLKKLQKVSAA